MTTVRPVFADSVHDTIAGELRDALALKVQCPQQNQQPAQTAPPQTNPPPPPPPPPPVGQLFLPGLKRLPPLDPLDSLEDDADDTVDAYWSAYDHCDKDGMKKALDHLRDIARQVHQMHQMATAAGKYSHYNSGDVAEMIDLEDDIHDFIDDSVWDIPKCPPPQTVPRTGTGCPPSNPKMPRESLLQQPLNLKFGYIPRLTYSHYAAAILDYHNSLRVEFGSPPLQWNPVLAAHALDYAKTMTETGQLVHAPRAGREDERENLSLSLHGANSLQTMLDGWGMEYGYLKPGVFPNVSTTADWMKVGHISQIVWPTTTQVGCGFYGGMRFDALVCRYSPPGNTDGTPLVSPRQTDCWKSEEFERRQ